MAKWNARKKGGKGSPFDSERDPLAEYNERIDKLNEAFRDDGIGEFTRKMRELKATEDAITKSNMGLSPMEQFKAADDALGGLKNALGVFGVAVDFDPFPTIDEYFGGIEDKIAELKESLGGFSEGLDLDPFKPAKLSPLAEGALDLQAFKELQGLRAKAGDNSPRFAGAVEAGSKDAYSIIAKAEAQNNRGSIEEEIKKLQEQQLRVQEQQLAEGKAARRAFDKFLKPLVVKF